MCSSTGANNAIAKKGKRLKVGDIKTAEQFRNFNFSGEKSRIAAYSRLSYYQRKKLGTWLA